MGVGTRGGNEWIEKLTPELRPNVPNDLSPAVGATALSDAVEQLATLGDAVLPGAGR